MATVPGELARQRLDVRRWLLRHPETVASILVALAWLWLVSIELRGASVGGHAGDADDAGMPGMDSRDARIADAPGWWVLMSVAMMGPAALAGVRHTGLNSLRWRRGRAMAGFAAAYLAVWAVFGAIAITVVAVVPGAPGTVGARHRPRARRSVAADAAQASLAPRLPSKRAACRPEAGRPSSVRFASGSGTD